MKSREEFLAWATKYNADILDAARQMGRYVRYQYARLPGKFVEVKNLKTNEVAGIAFQPGAYTGVFIAVESANGNLSWGWSSRHPTKERKPFNKVEGLYRAIKNLGADAESVPMRNDDHLRLQFRQFQTESVLEMQEKRNERVACPESVGD